MLKRIIHLSIAHRWAVLAIVFALGGLGVWSFQHLPIDATPDITNVQVQINTEAPGYSPLEAEQRVNPAARAQTQYVRRRRVEAEIVPPRLGSKRIEPGFIEEEMKIGVVDRLGCDRTAGAGE